MVGALEEKVVDCKGRKRGEGGKTKEKDIMKKKRGKKEEKRRKRWGQMRKVWRKKRGEV